MGVGVGPCDLICSGCCTVSASDWLFIHGTNRIVPEASWKNPLPLPGQAVGLL
jgi:hypothetical protein